MQKISEKYGAEKQALMTASGAADEPAQADEATRAKIMEITTRSQTELRSILAADQQRIFDENVAQIKQFMEFMEHRMKQLKDRG